MPKYEVKAWITVEATDEDDAIAQASDLLDDHVPPYFYRHISIEGEGAVAEVEEDE